MNPDIEYCSTIFPFNYLSSIINFLACCTNTDSNLTQWKDLENYRNSSLSLKPSSNLELLVSLTMLFQEIVITLKKFYRLNIMR